MKTKVKVRKPFKFLPGVVWAIILDLLSILLLALGIGVVLVLSALSIGVGSPAFGTADQIFTVLYGVVQLLATYLIFDEPKMLIVGGAKTIPLIGTLLDLLPSYTAVYILIEWGYL